MFKCKVYKVFIVSVILIASLPGSLSAQDDNNKLFYEILSRHGQVIVLVSRDVMSVLNDIPPTASISSVNDKGIELVVSPPSAKWFLSLGISYTILPPADLKGILMAPSVPKAMEWDMYPDYNQYVAIMNYFATTYPSLCILDTIGTTNYGKLVLVLKISDNAATDEDEPEVFYSSTMHGDETGGFILMMRLADYLLSNYPSEGIKELVDGLEIWINPLANPDGTYRNGTRISSPIRRNANNIDLNRNFPDPDYPNAVYEKETIDMVAFLRKHKFVLSANFHSGEEVVNYPWDKWDKLHADDNWFRMISRRYADTVHNYSPPGYMTFKENGITNGAAWYQINGGRQDFVTYELHGREVTIELDNIKETPVSELNALWNSNREALLGYLENALYGIHGTVIDSLTRLPVEAKVYISGHDADSSHVYSDENWGRFVRMLTPGLWTLTFSAPGYITKTIENISVTDRAKTEILVELNQRVNPVDTIDTMVPIVYPNPATSGYIKIVLPQSITGEVNVSIYSSSGSKVISTNTIAFSDTPLITDIHRLIPGIYLASITRLDTKVKATARFIVLRK